MSSFAFGAHAASKSFKKGRVERFVALEFELVDRAASGRIGRLKTPHGTITTPTLLPVINPNIELIPAREMRSLFGTEMVITNSYVIRKTERLREQALHEGVHAVLDWDGPVMTDSGTFQQYMYGEGTVEFAPDDVVAFQRDIGVDVGTILDIFSTPDRDFRQAMEDVAETTRRAESAAQHKGDMALATTVQGGVHPMLREDAARGVAEIGDLFPIGGVVPLMEQQRYGDLARVIIAAKSALPAGKPVHLFGCGHPMVFPMAVALGCDLFDSSAYAKYARDGRMIFPDGTRILADIEEFEAVSPVSAMHTAAELKRLDAKSRERLLAEHNLYVCFAELRRVREAIRQGTLWELVEQRATSHPSLMEALAVLEEEPIKRWLETHEPVSGRRAVFYTGPHTIHRPIIHRMHERLRTRYHPPAGLDELVLLDEGPRPFLRRNEALVARHLERARCHFVVDGHLGPVPIELDEMYPLAQCVVPEHVDGWTRRQADGVLGSFVEERFEVPVLRDGDETEDWGFHAAEDLYADPALLDPEPKRDGPGVAAWPLDELRVRATADMQFGPGASVALFGASAGPWTKTDGLSFTHSRKTGRIRNVHVEGEHVVSIRAADGLMSLTSAGAVRLHASLPAPQLRVQVEAESATFNGEGRNVMARFVAGMDPTLRPGDDCLVVDPEDRLVAHGRVILLAHEVASFQRGLAVRVREGLCKGAAPQERTPTQAAA